MYTEAQEARVMRAAVTRAAVMQAAVTVTGDIRGRKIGVARPAICQDYP